MERGEESVGELKEMLFVYVRVLGGYSLQIHYVVGLSHLALLCLVFVRHRWGKYTSLHHRRVAELSVSTGERITKGDASCWGSPVAQARVGPAGTPHSLPASP